MAREVLMSIHHNYVEKILAGTKQWEFRRRTALRAGDRVWMYATAPCAAVLGWFEVGYVLELDAVRPDAIVARDGASTPQELAEYFSGRTVGYGLKVRRRGRLQPPLSLPGGEPGPQSYRLLGSRAGDAVFLHELQSASTGCDL